MLVNSGLTPETAVMVNDGISTLLSGGRARIGKVAVGFAGKGKNVARALGRKKIHFGQASVGPHFSKQGSFKGRSISAVSDDLKAGRVSPNDIPLNVIKYRGKLVTLNNRSLLALKRAKMKPTVIRDKTGDLGYLGVLKRHLQGNPPSDVIKVRGGPRHTSYLGG